MTTTVWRTINNVAEYNTMLKAARALKAVRITARANGIWKEARPNDRGELISGPVTVRRVTSRGRVEATVDGKSTMMIPYVPYLSAGNPDRPESWISLEIEF